MLRDKRRTEERIAAMKHQQPQMNNGQQQEQNRQLNFENIMLNFCLLLTKRANKARTQRVHNTACWKTDTHVQRMGMSVTVLT